MRLVLQRVTSARVAWSEDGGEHSEQIGRGLCILAGAAGDDEPADVRRLAAKVAQLRIFGDDAGRFNLSLQDVEGEALVVSQFTLFADMSRGRRPSFIGAGAPEEASARVDEFAQALRDLGVPTRSGRFGAHMTVSIDNDGPVTIVMSTDGWMTQV